MPKIIYSILDNDMYKINMQRVYFYRFSDVMGEFKFKCRSPNARFTKEMIAEINKQVNYLCDLTYTDEELAFLKAIWYHKDAVGFLEFLRFFRFNRDFIKITEATDNCGISIVAKGPLWAVSPFEIPVLAIVNEVYFKYTHPHDYCALHNSLKERFGRKIVEFQARPFSLTEFGTRRRLSFDAQDYVVDGLRTLVPQYLAGTSNVLLAMKYGIKPIGTFAHEYVCMPQGLSDCSLRNSQRYAWDQWCREYKGALGICLTDTLGQEKFERDFDRYWANMFTGLRHDSGDPHAWGERAIELYKQYDIDPATKTLMFSDSLNFDKCWELEDNFFGRVKTAYGIGTWLTNDTFDEPLNIVMKLVRVNDRPVAKLSNVETKANGDAEYVARLRGDIAN